MYHLDPSKAVWREIEGEVVVLGDCGRRYMAVNGAGAALWPLLIAGATSRELEGRLVLTFPEEVDDPQADVRHFLEELDARGLLLKR